MSYARFDDAHENGRLSEFCQRLSGEVRLQSGEEFPIFQDRKDIHFGQNWRQRIEESLDEVTFLIPILTPGFFKSEACRAELERFLEREERLGRNDLILPVYYVNYAALNDKQKRQGDALANLLWSRQYVDWREVRFEPLTSPQIGKMFAGMATQIVEALERGEPAQRVEKALAARASEQSATSGAPASRASGVEVARSVSGPVPKTEPTTTVVDWLGRGDSVNLTQALAAAKPGARILVRPGLYKEGLVIDKPVEIVGDGEFGEVVIEANGKTAVLFQAAMGRVANLTLRQAGGGDFFCVDVAQGRLELEGCDITSQSNACVGIRGGADPRLRRNRIRDGRQGGIFIYAGGQGTIEDNEIFSNALAGVEITGGANATLRNNRIRNGKTTGIIVSEDGQGTIEDNDVFGNSMSGIEIKTRANPTVRRNRIHDDKQAGIVVSEDGKGTIEDNEIFGNGLAGIAIRTGGEPKVLNNRIHGGKEGGVMVLENGKGRIEDNDIFGNAFSGVESRTGGDPSVRRNRITKNLEQAIYVHEGGKGTFEGNDLRENGRGAWNIAAECLGSVKRSGNKE
jgi:F-box protein 11